MNPRAIEIKGRKIGRGHPCFIIAEAGVNHNGSLETARQLVDIAARAGANAIKFQTFVAKTLASPQAPKAIYQQRTTGFDESQLDMLRKLELSFDDFHKLHSYCGEQGILFMSTPFDEECADFLAALGVAAFKIPSGEIINLPFISHVARKGKPLIVSTGMARLSEVADAVSTIHQAGNYEVALLQCVSNYPAEPADVNLRAMRTMEAAFNVPVGYSDHTIGLEISLVAAAVGACIIEKHFTLDRNLPGPDHQTSLEPEELGALVRWIRTVEAAMGHGLKYPADSELNTMAVARKSLVAACDIPAGTVLTEELIAIRRPGTGLLPAVRPYLLGRTVREFTPAGTVFALEMFT